MEREAIRILIELEAKDESVSGRMLRLEPRGAGWAAVAGAGVHEFSGWLGLLNALQTLAPSPPHTHR